MEILKRPRRMRVRVLPERCTGCGRCADKCRYGAIGISYLGGRTCAWLLHSEYCTGCEKCLRVCPEKALERTELPAR